mgnify:FL=1
MGIGVRYGHKAKKSKARLACKWVHRSREKDEVASAYAKATARQGKANKVQSVKLAGWT